MDLPPSVWNPPAEIRPLDACSNEQPCLSADERPREQDHDRDPEETDPRIRVVDTIAVGEGHAVIAATVIGHDAE